MLAAYHFCRQSHSFEKDGTACAQKEEKMSSRRFLLVHGTLYLPPLSREVLYRLDLAMYR